MLCSSFILKSGPRVSGKQLEKVEVLDQYIELEEYDKIKEELQNTGADT